MTANKPDLQNNQEDINWGNLAITVLSTPGGRLKVEIPIEDLRDSILTSLDSNVRPRETFNDGGIFRFTLDCNDEFQTELSLSRTESGGAYISLTPFVLGPQCNVLEPEEHHHIAKIAGFIQAIISWAQRHQNLNCQQPAKPVIPKKRPGRPRSEDDIWAENQLKAGRDRKEVRKEWSAMPGVKERKLVDEESRFKKIIRRAKIGQ